MWHYLKEHLKTAFVIAGAVAIVLFVFLVGLFVYDQFSPPEKRRLSGQTLRAIRSALTTPGQDLAVSEAPAAPAPLTESERAKAEMERRQAKVGGGRPAEDASGAVEGGSAEAAQLEIAFLGDLKKAIASDMAALADQQKKYEAQQQVWRQERDREKTRVADMAHSTLMQYLKTQDAAITAQDWDAMFQQAKAKAVESALADDLTKVFQLLPSGVRTEIAAALSQEVRLAILDRLRAQALASAPPAGGPGAVAGGH
jgi:hypothetical protein